MQEAPRTRDQALAVIAKHLNISGEGEQRSGLAAEQLSYELTDMSLDTQRDAENGRLSDAIDGAKGIITIAEAIQTLMEWDVSKTISGFVPDMVIECIAETFDNMEEADAL